MRVLTIFGTRPEAIKLAPVHRALEATEGIESRVCVTGQHREMLKQVLDLFDLKPDVSIDVMKPNQSLAGLTRRLLQGLDEVLEQEKPDWVVVQGDTTTTFVGALAAFYRKIPVAHVEAGLRSGNIYSPFPEEINRSLVGPIAKLHFAPTQANVDNLLACGISKDLIHLTGNTVIDALLWSRDNIKEEHLGAWKNLPHHKFQGKRLILVTGHRRESFGDGFREMCQAIREVVESAPDLHVLYPVHLNPNVQKPVNEILAGHPQITLCPPLPYPDFVRAMDQSYLILTDSGGVQEEAPSLGKPVVVMREVTERMEAVKSGNVVLAGTGKEKIISEAKRILEDLTVYKSMSETANPYGDGNACKKIASIMAEML